MNGPRYVPVPILIVSSAAVSAAEASADVSPAAPVDVESQPLPVRSTQ